MYADTVTSSMRTAIDETNRRRARGARPPFRADKGQ
jgi:excinuclease UvrABC helicase subunit UvrB